MKNLITNLKKCTTYMINCKKELVLILLFSFLLTLISVVIPSISANIINSVVMLNFEKLIIIIILGAVLEVFYTVFKIIVSKNYLQFKKKFIVNIRKAVCRSLINFNVDEYYKNNIGSILNKMQADSSRIVRFINSIESCLFALIGNIGIIIYIFYFSYYIGLYYILTATICFIIRYYGVKKSIDYKKMEFEYSDNNITLLNEVMTGAKDIKTLNLKEEFISKTDDSFENISDSEYKSASFLEYTSRASVFLETIFNGIMIVLSVFLIKNNLLTTSTFIIIFMYKKSIYNFSGKFANLINYLSQFSLACDRVFSILDYKKESYGNIEKEKINGKISFKNVTFSYENENVLNNFNLEIKPKSFISIIGPTGSGKSTILKLITKMYSCNSGEILIDDIDINDLTEKTLKTNISLVNQNPHLFNFSINENLKLIESSGSKVREVCKIVGMHKKIESLKDGYNTKIGPDAYILSGGEKQKLAIARSLLSKSKIILLDEITNNLDNQSSYEIKQILNKLKGKYTIILVTHDLDMVSNSDRVIVLEKGKIIGDDTPTNLLKNNKFYKKLYNINKEGEV